MLLTAKINHQLGGQSLAAAMHAYQQAAAKAKPRTEIVSERPPGRQISSQDRANFAKSARQAKK